MLRVWTVLFTVAAAGVLWSCSEPTLVIDRKTDALIESRQRQVLGEQAVTADPPVPTHTELGGSLKPIYDPKPPTTNPEAADLPVRAAEPGPATPDDGLAAVVDPVQLDLPAALGYAIEHARDYRNERERLFLTTLALLAEEHLWGPRFFDTVRAQVSGTPESGDYDQVAAIVNELGVNQRLPYGGEVSVSALVDYTNYLQQSTANNALDSTQSARLAVNAEIPLLRGAGLVAREDLIQARRDLVYAVRGFERFRRELLFDIASDYFDLIQTQQAIENQRRQAENFEWLQRRIAALAEAGREPFFEVQRAEQQVLFARNNLLNAQESYQSALDAFKVRIGMPVSTPLEIVPTELVVPAPELDVELAVATGLKLRLDLQTTRDQVDDAARRVQVARNGLLPDLDLFGSLSLPTDRERRFGGADFNTGQGLYTAGARLDIPLDRRIEELRLRQAQVQLERAHRSHELERQRVAQTVRAALRRIEQSRFSLELQNRNIEVARKRLRGVLLRLRTLGPRDFIEAQDDLLEARNRRDEAIRDLRVSVLGFLLESGQLRVGPAGQWLAPGNLQPAVNVVPEAADVADIAEGDAAESIDAAPIDAPAAGD